MTRMSQNPSINNNDRPVEITRAVYKNWRERFVIPLLIGTLVIGLFALIPAMSSAEYKFLDGVFLAVYVAVGLVTIIRFPYWLRMGVFLLMVYILGLSELLATGILGDSLFFFLAFIILTTMMFSPRAGMGATTINILTFVIVGWLNLSGNLQFVNPESLTPKLEDWISAAATTILFGVVIIMGFRRLEVEFLETQQQVNKTLDELKTERNNLEKNVSDRTRHLRRVNEIARSISSILDPDELLSGAVQHIGSEFECYYTAIFLLDSSGQWAELKEATGDAGRVLKANKHHIDVNGKNMLGTTIRTRQPRILLESESDRFEYPLLPYTRSQIILPLIVGDQVLGALDMQSTKENAFESQDIDTLQNMANQIAIALENARLFREAQQSLSELRATQRQYLENVWTKIASEQDLEYGIGDEENTGETKEIEVPLALRDQIIGRINLAMNEDWTPDQKILVESIATQAALALENARLVEESQSTATRERLANEITSKIWASTTVDAILQTTIRELGRTLEAFEVNIEISADDTHE
jgi:GAF domain-containing protein